MTEILQYVQKDGAFHKLHTLTKIFFVLVVSVISIFSISIPVLLAVLIALLAVSLIADLHREILRQFVLIAMMSVIMIVLAVLTLPNGPVVGYILPEQVPFVGGSLPVTTGAILLGVIMALRFAILVLAVQLFVMSTRPRDLIHTLERMHIPVDFTLMFVIALRFIPTLQIEGKRIQEAQLARGYNPGSGVGGRFQRLIPIMIPLVSNALSRANVLGLTIDIRGYRTRERTMMRETGFQTRDYAVLTLLMTTGIGFIAIFLGRMV
ncbi:MAG: energy-coupling factor transporter transmembrane protein EcfT [Veillonellaceae bacterium]|nr:energy-coupling factor transporter transmembrane protein EcfT [Veillonellaceae bacterium]